MNRRLFLASIAAAASVLAASGTMPALAYRPLPVNEGGRSNGNVSGDGGGKGKGRHRKRGGRRK